MLFQKRIDREAAKIVKGTPNLVMTPVPPRERHQPVRDGGGETLPDRFCGNASNNRVGRHILCDNGVRRYDSAVTNSDFRLDGGGVANPCVIPN